MDQLGISLLRGLVLKELGRILTSCGEIEMAESRLQQTLAWFRSIGYTLGEAHALGMMSRLANCRGEHQTARDEAQRSIALAHELGNQQAEAESLCHLGESFVGLGRLDGATEAYRQALSLFEALGNALTATEARAGLADIALRQGDQAQALVRAEEMLAVLAGHDAHAGLEEPFFVHLACARVLKATGDPRAEAVLRAGRRLLLRYADCIDDESLRRSYLERVPVHRELWEAENPNRT